MGMYTEIYVNVDFVENLPKDFLHTLIAIVDGNDDSELFFNKPSRWVMLFSNGSYYTPSTNCRNLTFDSISKQWSLLGKGDIKNYGGEIESFFNYIRPYVDASDGEFIGYSRYEEDNQPKLFFK